MVEEQADHSARQFWRELDGLRRQQGLSYQRLAKLTSIPHSTLHGWMTRRAGVAAWAEVQRVVVALGGSEPEWLRRWKRVTGVPGSAAPSALTAQAQLPMDIVEFTGRREESRFLLDWLDPGGTAVAVAAIEGMAGVGKTRLAVHLAHQLISQGRADEIQLFVDLQGHSADQPPAEPETVLAEMLRLLGVPNDRMPCGRSERATLYRAKLHGRRAVVVLDNASDEEQVRWLLPGSPTCLVIITSRRKLTGLDGVRTLTLDVFETGDALALLSTVIGADRVRTQPDAAREIVERCGHLPLAVALAARRLRGRPTWTLAHLAERLRAAARRLAELSCNDRAVRAAFSVSYQHLPAEQRRVFRLLALHPGPDFTAESVAALTAIPVDTAEELLEALLDEHLLEQTAHPRYRFHDLVHIFAMDRVLAEESRQARSTALRRLLTWYLHTANRADRALALHHRRLPLTPADGPTPLTFQSDQDALSWYTAERRNLIAAVSCAMTNEWHDLAWRLPAVLYGFFLLRKHWDEWIDTHRTALAATRRVNNPAAEAWIQNGLGIAYAECHRSTEAIDCFHASLSISRQLADCRAESLVLNNIGETYRRLGRYADAIEYYVRDRAICQELADRHGEGISLNNIGKAMLAMGRHDTALLQHREALTICHELGDRCGAAEILNDLGDTHRGRHEFHLAAQHYQEALAMREDIGDLHGQAQTLHNLGEIHQLRGRTDTALTYYQQALTIWRTINDQRAKTETLNRIASLST